MQYKLVSTITCDALICLPKLCSIWILLSICMYFNKSFVEDDRVNCNIENNSAKELKNGFYCYFLAIVLHNIFTFLSKFTNKKMKETCRHVCVTSSIRQYSKKEKVIGFYVFRWRTSKKLFWKLDHGNYLKKLQLCTH